LKETLLILMLRNRSQT